VIGEPGLDARSQNHPPEKRSIGTVYETTNHEKLTIKIWLSPPSENTKIPAIAIIDSGADCNFISQSFATKHRIPCHQKTNPLELFGADGCLLTSGKVVEDSKLKLMYQTPDLQQYSDPDCQFEVMPSGNFEVILGLPWLRHHRPYIDWTTSVLYFNTDLTRSSTTPDLTRSPITSDLTRSLPIPQEVLLSTVATQTQPTSTNPSPEISLPPQYADFEDVFKEANANKLPPHRPYDCCIDLLPGKQPPCGQIYPLSRDEDKLLQEYIRDNLAKEFIRESTSSAGAPIFFVDKGKKSDPTRKVPEKRLVVNYQGLDKITEKFSYPLPLIIDLLDTLKTATIFTKIDLRSAYNLVRIREGDEWKTAFRTKHGLYEFQVMPFGLANAPAYFQRFVNDIFKDMRDKFVVIYLDDFLIFSNDPESHIQHVQAVLQRLRENHLYAKLEKCQFSASTVKFLGYNISANGIASDEDKVKSIAEWPVPTTKHQVQVFLGLTNYLRKFVDDFAQIALPLQRLTRKRAQFIWSEDCQKAFESLKSAISAVPVLAHPDHSKPFWVETDASDFAIGCVLSQLDPDGNLRPCAYYSRSMEPAERNYSVPDKELLAIKTAFEEWRHHLEGADHSVTVLSDHKGLESLGKAKVVNQRHARWSIFFRRFTFTIKYRPGVLNSLADSLSRRSDYKPSDLEKSQIEDEYILGSDVVQVGMTTRRSAFSSFMDRVKEAIDTDSYYQSLTDTEKKDQLVLTNGVPHFQNRIYIPDGPLRLEALETCHDSKLAGHFGTRKTSELVKRKFYWPNMDEMIKEFCEGCQECGRSKSSRHLPYGPLMPLPIPDRPWTSLGIDFITDLPLSEGMTVIFTVVDRFTKMAHFIPMPKIPDADETARVFIKEIVRLHGLPLEIISDRGTQFTSRFWKRFLEILNIKSCLSTAYHPQTNGQTERTNQTLEQYLRCYCSYNQDDWMPLLPLAEFAYNNTCNASTKLTPFYANQGCHPRFEYLAPSEEKVPKVEDRLTRLLVIQEQLKSTLGKAQDDHRSHADTHRQEVPSLQIGDLVYLDARNITSLRPSKKLDSKRLGPFQVKQIVNPVAFELDLPPETRIHPVFHVSLLEKATINQFSGRVSCPPPIIVNGQEEFLVNRILDSRRVDDRLQYLIDWVGYLPSARCWEDEENVHAPAKVKQFHADYPAKPRPHHLQRGEEFSEGE
jgi:reverse transcriptase-like protein/integrase-like protein/chromodomain-containing protein/aspartyl protease